MLRKRISTKLKSIKETQRFLKQNKLKMERLRGMKVTRFDDNYERLLSQTYVWRIEIAAVVCLVFFKDMLQKTNLNAKVLVLKGRRFRLQSITDYLATV
jgi:hypothetical protein